MRKEFYTYRHRIWAGTQEKAEGILRTMAQQNNPGAKISMKPLGRTPKTEQWKFEITVDRREVSDVR